jgi:peptidoglycan/LPS O-acetylase OafA/YrhL
MNQLSHGYHQVVVRLRRTTTSGAYIPEIDGLRFLTISAIFIYHLHAFLALKSAVSWSVPVEQDAATQLTLHWYYAVHFFFAISGFVLGLPFAAHYLDGKRRVPLRPYYLRRLTRIEPPYIVSLLILVALQLLVLKWSLADLLPHLIASAVYLHNIAFGQPSLINSVAWTLEIEVQFYLLAPLMARLFALRSKLWRRALIIGIGYSAVTLQWLFQHATVLNANALDLSGLNLTIVNYLQFFLVGFLLADLYVADWKQSPGSRRVWDLVALGSLPALWLLWQYPDLSYFLFPALLFTFYVSVFRSVYARRILSSSLLTTIGGMCYTIYLYHFQVTWVLFQISEHLVVTHSFGINLILQTLLVGSALLAISAICFLLVEKPCMDNQWPARVWQWLRTSGAQLSRRAGEALD